MSTPSPITTDKEKWDKRYLADAALWASWSKDPSTKVGCTIVDADGYAAGSGYNGFPRGVADSEERLDKRNVRLRLTLHAEQNALQRAGPKALGGTAYVYPMPPCASCAAQLIQAGIKRIVSHPASEEQYTRWGEDFALAEDMYAETGVTLDLYNKE